MNPKESQYIPYYQYLQYTKWLIAKRDTEEIESYLSIPINISILINCCIVLEGFLYTLTKDYIKRSKKINSTDSKDLNRASWNSTIELFELHSNFKFDRSSLNWKAITILFQYRNLLVHGNEMKFIFHENGNQKFKVEAENKKFQSILEYCKENGLAKIWPSHWTVHLVTKEVANHFFDHMKKFAIGTFEMLPIQDRKQSTVDMFEFYNAGIR